MNNYPCFVTAGLLLVAICSVCVADSPGTQLTRDNLDKQPLQFRIAQSAATSDNRIRFHVTVQPKQGTVPPKLVVWLGVFDGKTPIVNCRIEGEQTKDGVSYEFLVAHKYLEASLLTIGHHESAPKTVPEEGNYFFVLKDFVSNPNRKGAR